MSDKDINGKQAQNWKQLNVSDITAIANQQDIPPKYRKLFAGLTEVLSKTAQTLYGDASTDDKYKKTTDMIMSRIRGSLAKFEQTNADSVENIISGKFFKLDSEFLDELAIISETVIDKALSESNKDLQSILSNYDEKTKEIYAIIENIQQIIKEQSDYSIDVYNQNTLLNKFSDKVYKLLSSKLKVLELNAETKAKEQKQDVQTENGNAVEVDKILDIRKNLNEKKDESSIIHANANLSSSKQQPLEKSCIQIHETTKKIHDEITSSTGVLSEMMATALEDKIPKITSAIENSPVVNPAKAVIANDKRIDFQKKWYEKIIEKVKTYGDQAHRQKYYEYFNIDKDLKLIKKLDKTIDKRVSRLNMVKLLTAIDLPFKVLTYGPLKILKGIALGTFWLTKKIWNSRIAKFLRSPQGILLLGFVWGFLWTKYLKPIFSPFLDWWNNKTSFFGALKASFTHIVNGIATPLFGLAGKIIKGIGKVIKKMLPTIKKIFKALKPYAKKIWDAILPYLKKAFWFIFDLKIPIWKLGSVKLGYLLSLWAGSAFIHYGVSFARDLMYMGKGLKSIAKGIKAVGKGVKTTRNTLKAIKATNKVRKAAKAAKAAKAMAKTAKTAKDTAKAAKAAAKAAKLAKQAKVAVKAAKAAGVVNIAKTTTNTALKTAKTASKIGKYAKVGGAVTGAAIAAVEIAEIKSQLEELEKNKNKMNLIEYEEEKDRLTRLLSEKTKMGVANVASSFAPGVGIVATTATELALNRIHASEDAYRESAKNANAATTAQLDWNKKQSGKVIATRKITATDKNERIAQLKEQLDKINNTKKQYDELNKQLIDAQKRKDEIDSSMFGFMRGSTSKEQADKILELEKKRRELLDKSNMTAFDLSNSKQSVEARKKLQAELDMLTQEENNSRIPSDNDTSLKILEENAKQQENLKKDYKSILEMQNQQNQKLNMLIDNTNFIKNKPTANSVAIVGNQNRFNAATIENS